MHTLLDYESLLPEFVNITDGKCGDNDVTPKTRTQNVLIDEIIELTGEQTRHKYTKQLRRIAVWNDEHGYVVSLLTNNFKIATSTLTEIYKTRWMIKIFFKNIKQLLKIKSFIGTLRNAVGTQKWTALSTMLLLCWLKHIARYKWGLANLGVSSRLNTFTKMKLNK